MNAKKIVNLKISNLKDLPLLCRTCLHWEVTQKEYQKLFLEEASERKRQHLQTILTQWGRCGILYYGGNRHALAYSCYGPAKYFPRVKDYPAGPVSSDAIFLACLYVIPEMRGKGFGRMLLQAVEKDLFKRKFKAIEVFANKTSSEAPTAPFEFFLRHGFYILRDDKEFPLMRLDLKSIVSWQESVEQALESLAVPLGKGAPKKAPVPL